MRHKIRSPSWDCGKTGVILSLLSQDYGIVVGKRNNRGRGIQERLSSRAWEKAVEKREEKARGPIVREGRADVQGFADSAHYTV